MVILDKALKQREMDDNPVRVGVVGAGHMGRGIVLQIISAISGMRVCAVANRTLSKAKQAYRQAGVENLVHARSTAHLDQAIEDGDYAVTDDAMQLCEAEGVEVIIEVTGTIEFGARVAFRAIEHGKHVVTLNAELNATLGPILKVYAERAGVLFTEGDGDQPGVAMNLFRYVETIGYNPVLIGNIKGLLDPYRTPETQKSFAERVKQNVRMITSFADGTKLSMEQAVMANATGFGVGQRGMYGPQCAHVNEVIDLFPEEQMLGGGLTDFVLGAEPGPGVFVIGHNENSIKQEYLRPIKMGDGPFYVFYRPYHLCHLELPLSAARAVLFDDVTVSPQGAPVCEVITVAKRHLKAGETLDGIGGFMSYGQIDNIDVTQEENLLPMGLSEDCVLKRDIPKDRAISFDDVEVREGRLADELWQEQHNYFGSPILSSSAH